MKNNTENTMRIEELPESVQNEIRRTLKAYDECYVIFQLEKYEVSTGICVLGKYPNDYKFIGIYYAEDVYTVDERIINYAESFHDFSPLYKGVRDYGMMNKAGYDWSIKFNVVKGNLVIASNKRETLPASK